MSTGGKINITILDDHQGIVDGYRFRLGKDPLFEVVAALRFGDELEPALAKNPTDVLILDIGVPVSAENPLPYPIFHLIPKLLQLYPELSILVISMFAERGLIRGVMEAGANGYILKDDHAAISNLENVIRIIADKGVYFSRKAHQLYLMDQNIRTGKELSPRQRDALSLCASRPEALTADLAEEMSISNSTFRNLLSGAYVKLEVHTRAAAILKAQSLSLVTPPTPPEYSGERPPKTASQRR